MSDSKNNLFEFEELAIVHIDQLYSAALKMFEFPRHWDLVQKHI